MTAAETANAFRRLTVYTDVTCPALVAHIESCARAACPHGAVRLITTPTTTTGATVTATPFLQLWLKEKADVFAVVRDEVALMEQAECFITAAQTLASGEVSYALHCRQMPVLSLAAAATSTSTKRAPQTALEQELYASVAVSPLSAEEAIAAFLTFPTRRGAYLAVEDDAAPTPPAQGGDADDFTALLARITSLGNDAAAPTVVVRADGSPLYFSYTQRLQSATAKTPATVAPVASSPPAAYDALFEALVARHGDGARTALYPLVERAPQLAGALYVLNRYENRGLLRAMLHRGRCVVVLRHSAAALEMLKAQPEGAAAETMALLRQFEGHWLELPLPTVVSS